MRRHQQTSKAVKDAPAHCNLLLYVWGNISLGKCFHIPTGDKWVYPCTSFPHVSAEVREHQLPKKGQVSAFLLLLLEKKQFI